MTDQEKPKITIKFTERKRNLVSNHLKKLGKFYLIVVIAVALPEALLDLTGIAKFSFPEALIDFFVLTGSLIALYFIFNGVSQFLCHKIRSLNTFNITIQAFTNFYPILHLNREILSVKLISVCKENKGGLVYNFRNNKDFEIS